MIIKSSAHSRIYKKTADETVNNSNVLQDDDELTAIPLEANSTYEVQIILYYSSSNVADIKTRTNFSAIDRAYAGVANTINTANAATTSALSDAVQGSNVDLSCGGPGADPTLAFIRLAVRTISAMTLNILWAQNTAEVSDTKMRAGSRVVVTKL